MERKTIEKFLKKQQKDRGKKRNCKRCGIKISKGKSYCDICRDLNNQESMQRVMEKSKIEKARSKLLSSARKAYNVKELRELSTAKFGEAVTKCLRNEAVFVGVH